MNTVKIKHLYWKVVPYRIREKITDRFYARYRKNIIAEIDEELRNNPNDESLIELRNNIEKRVRAINYDFCLKYQLDDYIKLVEYDEIHKMYYVYRNGRKLYIKKHFNSLETAAICYMNICMEQDADSPHCYLRDGDIINGDILIDAGAAEGFFALDHIDDFGKIFLVECDELWLEALRLTFSGEIAEEKVIIVNRYLSDAVNTQSITIDEILSKEREYSDITLKMDIEGAESLALKGASQLLNSNKNINAFITTYHTPYDEKELPTFFNDCYDIEFSRGYMFFTGNSKIRHYLRKGVMRIKKSDGCLN